MLRPGRFGNLMGSTTYANQFGIICAIQSSGFPRFDVRRPGSAWISAFAVILPVAIAETVPGHHHNFRRVTLFLGDCIETFVAEIPDLDRSAYIRYSHRRTNSFCDGGGQGIL